MTEITIRVPDTLGEQLRQLADRLPEVLERGLHEVLAEAGTATTDEDAIIAVLTSQPTPQQILALHPSPEFQARLTDLLSRSKTSGLSATENRELDHYQFLEHIVRLAKGQALQRLAEKV